MKRSYSLLLMLCVILSACDSSNKFADLSAYMDEVRARPKGVIEPMPEEVVYEPFTYVARALRSPFQPPLRTEQNNQGKSTTNIKPDETRVKQFLESFAIEGFVMVGTLANNTGNYALLSTADAVYRISVGDYLGLDHGRVTAISATSVDIIEIISDGDGGWLERPRTLVLRERS